MARKIFLNVVLGAALLWILAAAAPEKTQQAADIIEELKLFAKTVGAIHEAYVGDTQPRQLYYEAVKGMLASLGDKYSQFFDPATYELVKMHIRGEYAGIGAMMDIKDGYPYVKAVNPDSPAARSGLLPMDKLLKIDGASMEKKELPEVAKLLRGEADTDVRLTILRPPGKEMEIIIKREKISIESVKDVRIVVDGIGYLRIQGFQDNTPAQVGAALETLSKKGMKSLIIDLRGNDGGLLPSAVGLSSYFLPKGKKVVSVKSKIKEQQKDYFTEKPGKLYEKLRLVILVNGQSASASEIFSACMQDYKRAVIVGTKTFGKASVQSVVPLDDTTAMKFTTARYMSPNGRMIDGIGLEPDEKVDAPAENGIDPQLVHALSILNKKK